MYERFMAAGVARTLRHAIVLEFVPKHCVYPGVFDVKSYRCF